MVDSYFSLLDMVPSFDIDDDELEKHYIAKQQKYHPDRFVMAEDRERIIALQMATDINAAYETLKDPLRRAEYLLELKGIYVAGEDSEVKPSEELLLTAMEDRERLQEAEDADAIRLLEDEMVMKAGKCEKELSAVLKEHKDAEAAQLTLKLRFLRKFIEEARLKRKMREN